jgi:23S rRNA (adenine2503-C2)-methyltransferase
MDFFNQTRQQLESIFESCKIPRIHAKNLFRAAYKELSLSPWTAPGLPKSIQALFDLEPTHGEKAPELAKILVSKYDATVKFLVRMADGKLVESVMMPETGRITLCLSSQVGCRQACTFCHTGRMGLIRNLTPAEIVSQVFLANRWLADNPEWKTSWQYPDNCWVSNIVFMGMGEPLDNVDGLRTAIDILSDPYGFHIPKRRIAVSTAGHLDGLKELTEHVPDVSLALSLHASTNGERSRLMPINRRWPIDEVLAFLKRYYETRKNRSFLLVQYTVIQGINDSKEHAERIIGLLSGIPVKINLIPLNEVDHVRFEAPSAESLTSFRDHFHRAGLRVMIRYSKGQDISAACGQLAVMDHQIQVL